jgi:hypothetical protein
MGRFGKSRVAGVAGTLVVLAAVVACHPTDSLSSANVSVSTDQLATKALKQQKVRVQWLSCGASEDRTDPKVDCVGRTSGQTKITVTGDVSRQWDLKCVRGHLTAAVGGRTVFDVRGLGNCTGPTPSGS